MPSRTTTSADRVLGALRQSGPLSRPELQQRTGLSRGTVALAVSRLVDQRLVRLSDPGPQSGVGRPAPLVQLDSRAGIAAGLDIGKRHVRVMVADASHEVLGERAVDLPSDPPVGEILDLAVQLVDEILQDIGCTRDMLVGAGLAVPGPLHRASGQVGSAAILPTWVGVRPRAEVQRRLPVPVWADNDANLGALAEWSRGAGSGASDLAYIKVATGIGCGLVIGGRVRRGAGGTAGELGHLPVMSGGPVCRCGNRGCLETMAGAEAMLALLRPTLGDLDVSEMVDRALTGDAACQRVLADTGALIGQATAALVNLFNPGRLVIGGPVAAAGELLLDPLRQAIVRSAIPSAAADLTLVAAELGERAEALGACMLVFQQSPTVRPNGPTVPA